MDFAPQMQMRLLSCKFTKSSVCEYQKASKSHLNFICSRSKHRRFATLAIYSWKSPFKSWNAICQLISDECIAIVNQAFISFESRWADHDDECRKHIWAPDKLIIGYQIINTGNTINWSSEDNYKLSDFRRWVNYICWKIADWISNQ